MRIYDKENTIFEQFSHHPHVFQHEFANYAHLSGAKYYVISDNNGDVFIPVLVNRSQFLNILTILYPPLSKNRRVSPELEESFFNTMITFIKKNKLCDRISFPMLLDVFQAAPKNADCNNFGNINIPLQEGTNEEIFKKFRKNYRYEINRCKREEVEIKFGENQFEAFYSLYEDTMNRNQLFLEDYVAIKRLFKDLYRINSIICGVVYHNGLPQGGVFIPYSKYAGYYLYGGSVERSSINGAIKALHWEVIQQLKSKGVKTYVLGGARMGNLSNTKYHGIQQFKMGFGSQLTEGLIWKQDINKIKCSIYDMLYYLRYNLVKRNK